MKRCKYSRLHIVTHYIIIFTSTRHTTQIIVGKGWCGAITGVALWSKRRCTKIIIFFGFMWVCRYICGCFSGLNVFVSMTKKNSIRYLRNENKDIFFVFEPEDLPLNYFIRLRKNSTTECCTYYYY